MVQESSCSQGEQTQSSSSQIELDALSPPGHDEHGIVPPKGNEGVTNKTSEVSGSAGDSILGTDDEPKLHMARIIGQVETDGWENKKTSERV